jgi:hypothetical protein
MKFHCCDPRRLDVIKRNGTANAIEFLEVLDRAAPSGAPRQQTLFVRLLRAGFAITPDNLRITGGERIRTVGVVWCAPADALPPEAEAGLVATVDDLPRTLVVRTDSTGDFSTYTLSIVADSGSTTPPAGFDPKLSSIEFSFKVECPSDFDCAQNPVCPPVLRAHPDIDYLAKDYQGFRRLMLDRLSLLVPDWRERSAADLGMVLVELIAYAADNLSYRQDAIANEAYLATARQRVSVRRHARLVDYFLHEGCNARAFVHFDVTGQNVTVNRGTQLLTRVPNLSAAVKPGSPELRDAIAAGALVFETARTAVLDDRRNRLSFYTWGDQACCLPRGTTRATLRGHVDGLNVGDIVIFEEVKSPTTFIPEDADRTHRWAVRLTEVTLSSDPSGKLFDEPPGVGAVDVTEIAWDQADALPFPLCLSVAERPGLEVSVARGNVVLADHGLTLPAESLGAVLQPRLKIASLVPSGSCEKPPPVMVPPRFRPALAQGPLTHGFDLAALLEVPIEEDRSWWPASSLLVIDPHGATPRIRSPARSAASWKSGRSSAISSRAAPPTRTSSSRPRTTAARVCASATTRRASGPIPIRSSRRSTASATARPGTSAPRPLRISSARATRSRPCAIPCRRPAASSRRISKSPAAMRRRRSAPRSAPSRQPITPPRRSAVPTCSMPQRRSAGPGAGTPSS